MIYINEKTQFNHYVCTICLKNNEYKIDSDTYYTSDQVEFWKHFTDHMPGAESSEIVDEKLDINIQLNSETREENDDVTENKPQSIEENKFSKNKLVLKENSEMLNPESIHAVIKNGTIEPYDELENISKYIQTTSTEDEVVVISDSEDSEDDFCIKEVNPDECLDFTEFKSELSTDDVRSNRAVIISCISFQNETENQNPAINRLESSIHEHEIPKVIESFAKQSEENEDETPVWKPFDSKPTIIERKVDDREIQVQVLLKSVEPESSLVETIDEVQQAKEIDSVSKSLEPKSMLAERKIEILQKEILSSDRESIKSKPIFVENSENDYEIQEAKKLSPVSKSGKSKPIEYELEKKQIEDIPSDSISAELEQELILGESPTKDDELRQIDNQFLDTDPVIDKNSSKNRNKKHEFRSNSSSKVSVKGKSVSSKSHPENGKSTSKRSLTKKPAPVRSEASKKTKSDGFLIIDSEKVAQLKGFQIPKRRRLSISASQNDTTKNRRISISAKTNTPPMKRLSVSAAQNSRFLKCLEKVKTSNYVSTKVKNKDVGNIITEKLNQVAPTSPVKTYVCLECAESFHTTRALETHMKRNHLGSTTNVLAERQEQSERDRLYQETLTKMKKEILDNYGEEIIDEIVNSQRLPDSLTMNDQICSASNSSQKLNDNSSTLQSSYEQSVSSYNTSSSKPQAGVDYKSSTQPITTACHKPPLNGQSISNSVTGKRKCRPRHDVSTCIPLGKTSVVEQQHANAQKYRIPTPTFPSPPRCEKQHLQNQRVPIEQPQSTTIPGEQQTQALQQTSQLVHKTVEQSHTTKGRVNPVLDNIQNGGNFFRPPASLQASVPVVNQKHNFHFQKPRFRQFHRDASHNNGNQFKGSRFEYQPNNYNNNTSNMQLEHQITEQQEQQQQYYSDTPNNLHYPSMCTTQHWAVKCNFPNCTYQQSNTDFRLPQNYGFSCEQYPRMGAPQQSQEYYSPYNTFQYHSGQELMMQSQSLQYSAVMFGQEINQQNNVLPPPMQHMYNGGVIQNGTFGQHTTGNQNVQNIF